MYLFYLVEIKHLTYRDPSAAHRKLRFEGTEPSQLIESWTFTVRWHWTGPRCQPTKLGLNLLDCAR
jgi:hypothetical protein